MFATDEPSTHVGIVGDTVGIRDNVNVLMLAKRWRPESQAYRASFEKCSQQVPNWLVRELSDGDSKAQGRRVPPLSSVATYVYV